MHTVEEIQHALENLSVSGRQAVAEWLENHAATERAGDVASQPGHYGVAEPAAVYGALLPEYMTLEEFLDWEYEGPEKYEYINGIIRAMSGASLPHGRVIQNLYFAVRSHLGRGPCEAFCVGPQLNLKIAKNEIVYQPDLMVSCDSRGWGKNWIHNPKLVVEVLSPSTQHIDRREKSMNYRRAEGIEEYVLAAQSQSALTIHRRAEDWAPRLVSGPGAVAEFRSIGLSVPLMEIYDGVL